MQDIAMHILDIAYNSLRASAKHLFITVCRDEKMLSIVIEDDGMGMDEETLKKALDPFYTSRKTRTVGLGLPLFKQSIEACGGTFKITSKFHKGTKISASFNLDHIDCLPIGRLDETLMCLLHGCNDCEVVFKYYDQKNVFVLDTREIKEILGDVDFREYEIYMWISDYVKEGLSSEIVR